MKPAPITLEIYQGATYVKVFEWLSDGVPVDLTNASIRAQLRSDVDSKRIILDLSSTNGLIDIFDPLEAKFQIVLPAPLTESLTFDDCVFDLKVNIDGFVSPLFSGVAVLIKSPTKKFED